MRGGLFFYVSYNFENYNQFDYSYQNIQIHKYNPLICLVPRFTSLNQYKGGTAAAAPVIKVTRISPSPEVIVPQNYQYVHIKFIAVRKKHFGKGGFPSRSAICSKRWWTLNGANERSRTADLFITNEVLCLLSYVSVFNFDYDSILHRSLFVKTKNQVFMLNFLRKHLTKLYFYYII